MMNEHILKHLPMEIGYNQEQVWTLEKMPLFIKKNLYWTINTSISYD